MKKLNIISFFASVKLITKIAWRNIWRHKGKSFVIGLILFIGTLLMTVGNGIVSGMERGFKENISETFTGDIVISSSRELTDDVLLRQMGTPLEVIENFEDLEKILGETEEIHSYLPMAVGWGNAINLNYDMNFVGMLGVDIDKYMEFFPDSIEILEGRNLKKGERGIILGTTYRDQTFLETDYWLVSEEDRIVEENLSKEAKLFEELDTLDNIVVMGMSKDFSSMDVKVPIKGVFRYKSLNKFWGNYSIVDIDSYREANNMITGGKEVELSEEELSLFDEDFSFGDDFLTDLDGESASLSFDDFESTLQDEINKEVAEDEKIEINDGAYQIALVRLHDINKTEEVIERLNKVFKENNIDAKAISWQKSIGILGNMATFIKIALNMFIIFIFFVAIIVIMNTLSMAAMERVTELGMMRAVGARKSFLSGMFMSETFFLSLFFGGIGIIVGIGVLLFISSLGLETTNEFLQIIYGGDVLNPVITISDITLGLIELTLVSILAVIYPIILVNKIRPLDALGND